jgi:hypothetical protein
MNKHPLPVEKYVLRERYLHDPSVAYELDRDELAALMSEVGETEHVIDAINVLDDAMLEQRARDIACWNRAFDRYDDSTTVPVSDLVEASQSPWSWGV